MSAGNPVKTPGATTAARPRRLADGYYDYLQGRGIDIGCADDPITPDCDEWDGIFGHGDAQVMAGLPAESYDWVYSSHCLEHMVNPWHAIQRWWELVKPGGYLLVTVPDEDLYEQGNWPSLFNVDHKWTFSYGKTESWSPVNIDVEGLANHLPGAVILRLHQCDTGYLYDGAVWDRTLGGAEAHIEIVLRKEF